MKFKLKEIGLDTRNLEIDPKNLLASSNFDYILTSISANNDFLISESINSILSNYSLVVYLDYLNFSERGILKHLSMLRKSKIDLLMIDANKPDWKFLLELKPLIGNKIISSIGIANPETVDDLKNKIELVKEVLNQKVTYIQMDICPLNFDLELIEYCYSNDLKIIGTNTFGGALNAVRNISTFTVPYLLGFSSTYSDVILLSSRDLSKSLVDKEYLNNLIGTESSPTFQLKKSTKKLIKPLKKVVYTSLRIPTELNVPLNNQSFIIDNPSVIQFHLGSYKDIEFVKKENSTNKFSIKDVNFSNLENADIALDIENYLNTSYYPEDGNLDIRTATARYRVLMYLLNLFPTLDGWKINFIKIGSGIFLINVKKDPVVKGHLFWKELIEGVEKYYYLVVPEDNEYEIRFIEDKTNEKDKIDIKEE